jgi:triacylglycerol lipase
MSAPAGYDNDLALNLAAACQLAYDMLRNPSAAAPAGYQVNTAFTADLFGRTEACGYVMSSADNAVLAFRGTSTVPDWLADGSYAQVDFPYVSGAGLTHGGFMSVYQSCRDQVLAALGALTPDRPLFVTGHSLGGALATLAALDVAVNSPFNAPVVYTFASPRVGDGAFADAYNGKVASSWRVLNTYDLVPLLPPEQIFDAVHRRTYSYRHVKDWHALGFFRGGIAGNHMLANYVTALRGG